LPFFSPGRAKKRHSFHDWRIGRREALSTPEARKGRGSEHGGFYAARSCTSGVDRRSRTEPESSPGNECRTGGPAEGCTALLFRAGVAGRTQARMDGKRRTPASPAVAAGEGRSILPANIVRRVWPRAHRDALRTEKTRPVHGRIARLNIQPRARSEMEKATCYRLSGPDRDSDGGLSRCKRGVMCCINADSRDD
jgi:hypothetical protein